MSRYTKKPVTIDALQWTGSNLDAALDFCEGSATYEAMASGGGLLVIETLESSKEAKTRHAASVGDWIIKGVKGEFYPIKPDIFESTYSLESRGAEGPTPGVDGKTSDGYHTFDELYEHRHALFAVACRFLDGWKSKLHDDGTMFDGWFIAGIETAQGQATYHMPMRLWEGFPARELEKAPAWDGHTPNDVIDRLRAALRSPAPAPLVDACGDCGTPTDLITPYCAKCEALAAVRRIVADIDTDTGARRRAHETFVPLSVLRALVAPEVTP
jgi:hypothetical protein